MKSGMQHEPVFSPYTSDAELVTQALPPAGWLADYVAWADPCSEAPTLYHLGAGLSCLATAIGRRARVVDATPFPLNANLFVCLIGAQGICRKSTALRFAETVLTQDFGDQLYTGDTTPEALGKRVLSEGPERTLILDEVSRLLGKDYRQGMGPLLAELYDCPRKLTCDRVGDTKFEPIPEPTVSVLAASTLSWLKRAVDVHDVGGGILSRFLWLVSDASGRTMATPPRPDQAAAANLSDRLLTLRDGLGGRDLSMLEAGHQWQRLYHEYIQRANAEADGDNLGGFMARLASGLAPKLALLYTVAADPDATAISPDVFAQVRPLCELLQRGLRRVLSDLTSNEFDQRLRKLAAFVAKHPDGVTQRIIMRTGPKPRPKGRELTEQLEALEMAGEVSWDKAAQTVKPTATLLEEGVG